MMSSAGSGAIFHPQQSTEDDIKLERVAVEPFSTHAGDIVGEVFPGQGEQRGVVDHRFADRLFVAAKIEDNAHGNRSIPLRHAPPSRTPRGKMRTSCVS